MRLPLHARLAGEETPPYKKAQEVGRTVVSRQTTHNYKEPTILCLNEHMVLRIDCFDN